MRIAIEHPMHGAAIDLLGSPLKLSDTPVEYNRAPPVLGQDTLDVMRDLLHLDDGRIAELLQKKTIQGA